MNTAKIICISQPLIEGISTAEEFIAYTARISNPSNQFNNETVPKLLKYLLDNKHFSPFEQIYITMDIHTTRDISHQIIRHRSFCFQEFSQRYSNPVKDLGFVTRDARLQDKCNRQNSIETNDSDLKHTWMIAQYKVADTSKEVYQWAIRNGIAKEQARAVLPEGLTNTRIYMSGTLRSWIHYIDVRTGESTQKEHQEVAIHAREEILKYFPSLRDRWINQKTSSDA